MAFPETLRRLLHPTGLKLAMGLAVLSAALYLHSFSAGQPEQTFLGRLEAKALDLKLVRRGPLEPSQRVTVVAVDERSLARYGLWPWDRGVMADLIDALTASGVRVIALDMGFTEPQTAGRHVALREVEQLYRRASAPPPTEAPVGQPVAGDGRYAELERFFAQEVGRGDPDRRLAEAIFRSGRVVWGLFADFQEGVGAGLSPEHREAAFERVAPFTIHGLHRLKTTGSGLVQEVEDGMGIADARFRPPDIEGGLESPLPEFSAATPFFGYMNVNPDPDGVLRRSFLVARYGDVLVPSLPLTAVAAYLNSTIHVIRDPVRPMSPGQVRLRVGSAESQGLNITDLHGALGWLERRAEVLPPGPWEEGHLAEVGQVLAKREARAETDADFAPDPVTLAGFDYDQVLEVPVDPWQQGRLLVNHLGPAATQPTVSVVDVLEARAPPELLAGRIALVGVTALGTFDQRVTPFNAFTPGVFVQAAIMDQLLTGRHIERPAWMVLIEVLLLLLLGAVVGLVLPRLRRGLAISGFITAGVVLWLALDLGLLLAWNVDLFTVTPVATFINLSLWVAVFQWRVVDREKRQVRRAFEHYLAPSVLESVLKDPKKLSLQPEKAELTVLFSDIRGFTTISERLTPEQLATVLNEYLTPLTHVVFEHGGTLDKYMGDAIMAFWGDPVPQADHALRACRAALAMQAEVERLAGDFEARGWPALEAGVGINTGMMSVGNFGSDVLFDYTVMGDAVNLGSRLEGANKTYGTRIIISEFTEAQVRGQVVARELDAVRVKGRREPLRIYELLGVGAPTESDRAFLGAFAEALAFYKAQLWEDAAAAFRRCVALRWGDTPSQLYIARCQEMQQSPPGEGWDGVYTFTRK